MVNLHTAYLIALVSQATSGLVLGMFAWVDRRSRWLIPLAVACALHVTAIYLVPLVRGTGLWFPQAISSAVLIAMFYLIHLGLQSLVRTRQARSIRAHAAISSLMLAVFALARGNRLWARQAAWITAIVVMAWTLHTLWTARSREPRWPLRVTALFLLMLLLLFVVRLPLEAMVPAPPVMLLLRQSTVLLVSSLAFPFLALYAAESRRRLHEESRLDALTGLPNRRAMEEAAAHQIKAAARHRGSCALLVLDLDNFKKLNDTWGHAAGDHALIAAGGLLLRLSKNTQHCSVARMGGEEFAILLSNCSIADAAALAGQLCADMAALRIGTGAKYLHITTSIGISALSKGETSWKEMLRRADVALYRAKRDGRNRAALCTEAAEAILGKEDILYRSRAAELTEAVPSTSFPGLPENRQDGVAEEAADSSAANTTLR